MKYTCIYHCVQHLRQVGVVGKFVEFFGPGVAQLSIADRATIANMCPEYGATVGFFAVDNISIAYLRQTGKRAKQKIGLRRGGCVNMLVSLCTHKWRYCISSMCFLIALIIETP